MSDAPAAASHRAPRAAPLGARLGAAWRHPNPVWTRELRQSARLTRTPLVLAVVTGLITLLMGTIGGLATGHVEPARVGSALHQTFFSIAFAVVAWLAPAIASSTIASERSGRTWEALQLTGLGAKTITRGKFLAAYSYVALYVVMLAPVGALSFLFGGVTATEVLLAYLLLLVFAAVAVAFGLGISSKFSNPAVAVVVSLLTSVPISLFVYLGLGLGLSAAMHQVWPEIPSATPVWLPTAYVRARLDLNYLALLIALPLALAAGVTWFFYEVCVANMAGPSDDRSSGLRRWFLVNTTLVAIASLLPVMLLPRDAHVGAIVALVAFLGYLVFGCLLFAGEPLGPSHRTQLHWERHRASRWTRWMGPGLMPALGSLLTLGLTGLGLQTLVGIGMAWLEGSQLAALQVIVWGAYATAFFLFLAGLTALSRARAQGPTAPRVVLLLTLFVVTAGPWVVAAIAGVLADGSSSAIVSAAPSPVFAAVMASLLDSTERHRELALAVGSAAILGWALLGVALLGAGAARSRRLTQAHHAARRELEQALRAEEEEALDPTEAPGAG